MVKCPECDEKLIISSDVKVSEVILCNGCFAQLEVISLSPLSLSVAPEIEEDWGE